MFIVKCHLEWKTTPPPIVAEIGQKRKPSYSRTLHSTKPYSVSGPYFCILLQQPCVGRPQKRLMKLARNYPPLPISVCIFCSLSDNSHQFHHQNYDAAFARQKKSFNFPAMFNKQSFHYALCSVTTIRKDLKLLFYML